MKILENVKKIPGGLMVVPLLLGAIINTFVPQVWEIGGFTAALFKTGALPFIAAFLLCSGAQINFKKAGVPLVKGLILTILKFAIGAIIGVGLNKIFGPAGVLGITPLAAIAAMTNSNGGLYAALAGEFGDSSDVGAISILSINDGPFLTMIALGASGIASIPLLSLVAVILPIVIGCLLGNLDEDIANFLKPGTALLIPLFAFPLGAGLNLKQVLTAGMSGILLGVLTAVITGFAGYYAMKLIKSKKPQAGAAIGTTAGNAAATPAAIAEADPSMTQAANAATAQVAASVIVTALLCPAIVSFLDKREKKKLNNSAKTEVKKDIDKDIEDKKATV